MDEGSSLPLPGSYESLSQFPRSPIRITRSVRIEAGKSAHPIRWSDGGRTFWATPRPFDHQF
jgi:hypothetical protein